MACLYISYFFAISAGLVWAYLYELTVNYTKVNRGVYLLAEFSKISMQQSQICVITEFCFQIRLLTEGNFLSESTRSVTSSFSEKMVEQSNLGKQLIRRFSLGLLTAIAIDLILLAYAVIAVIYDKDPKNITTQMKVNEMIILSLVTINLISYIAVACIYHRGFKFVQRSLKKGIKHITFILHIFIV